VNLEFGLSNLSEPTESTISEVKGLYEVAKWLIEERKLRLHESLSIERYKEVCKILEELTKR